MFALTFFPSLFLISGNDSKVDGLVNFEKLRMIAKEIRHVGRMASVNMDPALMFRTRYDTFPNKHVKVPDSELIPHILHKSNN